MLSLTSDYCGENGSPESPLKLMADAGFSHVHWCHRWRSDYLYTTDEIDQIGEWLRSFGLRLNDVHGSEGIEKFWYSPDETARRAGIELVKNRIELAARLGGDAVVMHVYPPTQEPRLAVFNDHLFDQVRRSLDDVEPYARARGVRIALETLIDFSAVEAGVIGPAHAGDNAELLSRLLAAYDPEFLGFCFDSGHAILGIERTPRYEALFARLSVLHLHDNDGVNDLHWPLYEGKVNWAHLAALIAASPYNKPISFELSNRNTPYADPAQFLRHSMEGCRRFAAEVAARRAALRER